MEYMTGTLHSDFEILERALSSFQKKHPSIPAVIGTIVKDFESKFRPVWRGDVAIMADFPPSRTESEENAETGISLPQVRFFRVFFFFI